MLRLDDRGDSIWFEMPTLRVRPRRVTRRPQLRNVQSAITRSSIAAGTREVALRGAPATGMRSLPSSAITLATWSAEGGTAGSCKLRVLLKPTALSNLGAIQTACKRLIAEDAVGDDALSAAHHAEQACALRPDHLSMTSAGMARASACALPKL